MWGRGTTVKKQLTLWGREARVPLNILEGLLSPWRTEGSLHCYTAWALCVVWGHSRLSTALSFWGAVTPPHPQHCGTTTVRLPRRDALSTGRDAIWVQQVIFPHQTPFWKKELQAQLVVIFVVAFSSLLPVEPIDFNEECWHSWEFQCHWGHFTRRNWNWLWNDGWEHVFKS